MPGKPFQSSLIPYQNEIATLRSSKPPVSYARIAVMLREKHGLSVQRAAIAKFVKVRSGGRKVYFFRKDIAAKKSVHPQPVERLGHAASGPAVASNPLQQQPPKPKFEFTYSERYNLHRLPPEEAAARRKKLEAEGH